MTITTLVTFIRLTNANGEVEDGFLYQNGQRNDTSKALITDSRDIDTVDYVKDDKNAISYLSNNAKAAGLSAEKYYYLPFIYQGASKNRNGDNLEAGLIFANNILTMNRAREVVTKKWHVEVSVCTMNAFTYDLIPDRTLTSDVWLASSLSYDSEVIEVLLSSAIDAVGSNAPNRVLTSAVVGALPTSSQIQNI